MISEDERKRREAEQLKQSNEEAAAAQQRRSIAAAIAYDETKPSLEKRRRAQAMANTDAATRQRNDFDPWTGE